MKCPHCGKYSSRVMESRDLEDGASIRRRRHCLECGYRYTTYERVERPPLTVIKKDGRRQPFIREKIASGLYRAFEKRPMPLERVEEIAGEIEEDIRALGEPEIPVGKIGEIVMAKLLELDDVAYVRFASVYRAFTDVESFQAELNRLKNRSPKA